MITKTLKYCIQKVLLLLLLIGVVFSFPKEETGFKKELLVEEVLKKETVLCSFLRQKNTGYHSFGFVSTLFFRKKFICFRRVKRIIEYCQFVHYC